MAGRCDMVLEDDPPPTPPPPQPATPADLVVYASDRKVAAFQMLNNSLCVCVCVFVCVCVCVSVVPFISVSAQHLTYFVCGRVYHLTQYAFLD